MRRSSRRPPAAPGPAWIPRQPAPLRSGSPLSTAPGRSRRRRSWPWVPTGSRSADVHTPACSPGTRCGETRTRAAASRQTGTARSQVMRASSGSPMSRARSANRQRRTRKWKRSTSTERHSLSLKAPTPRATARSKKACQRARGSPSAGQETSRERRAFAADRTRAASSWVTARALRAEALAQDQVRPPGAARASGRAAPRRRHARPSVSGRRAFASAPHSARARAASASRSGARARRAGTGRRAAGASRCRACPLP